MATRTRFPAGIPAPALGLGLLPLPLQDGAPLGAGPWEGRFWIAAALLLLVSGAFLLRRRGWRVALASARARAEDLERESAKRERREERILNVASGVSARTGDTFFQELVRYLAKATGANLAMIGARGPGEDWKRVRTLAVTHDGRLHDNFEYDPAGTPCDPVMAGHLNVCARDAHASYETPDRLRGLMKKLESYVGAPLLSSSGEVMGLLSVASEEPLADVSEAASLLRIFSARAAAELERQVAQQRQMELEKQVLHAQKLESLGLLAGGIAHDFNNLLAALLGHLNVAQALLSADTHLEATLRNMERIVQRATDLAGQMLAYSGKGHFEAQALDLNQAIEDLASLLSVSISKKTTLECRLAPSLPTIWADPVQIQQVVLNLVTNASEAIGDGAGTIRLQTGRLELDQRFLEQACPGQQLQPGTYVELAVEDSGCGIGGESLARIFDPFYTTKDNGRGLGLSATTGILRGHRAGIILESEVGVGTRFRLLFPAGPPEPRAAVRTPCVQMDLPQALVLVVDDEPEVREVARQMIGLLGLDTVAAKDGLDAVEQVRRDPTIDLVLMDLTMPRLDGREAFRRLKQVRPGLPVILSSGFNEKESVQGVNEEGLAGFLKKPYTLHALREKLVTVLGRPQSRSARSH
jgi:signal transduction histidine kinase/ActR/RegA family two-component response regulator